MADGKFLMNPAEARVRANEMIKIASELEDLLNNISRAMEEIDNVDTIHFSYLVVAFSPVDIFSHQF